MTLSKALKCFLTVVCLAACAAGHAVVNDPGQLTAAGVFAGLPHEVLDMLRPSTRLDMIDYYTQADSLISVTDALGGQSRFEQVAPDYLRVAVTPVSTLEIKVLPYGKQKLVMTIYTTGGEDIAKDSEIRFFDSELKPLSAAKFLKEPALRDFFNLKGSDVSAEELKEKVPFAAIAYTTGPGDAPLEASLTTLTTLSKETGDLLSPLLKPSLKASWASGFKFK